MTKFLITGDWHLTNKKPKNRTDNYVETQRRKIDFIFDLAVREKVNAILQPGDMFDHFSIPDSLKRDWIIYFKRRNIPIFTVPGQHDMRYHSSNINNTPMGVLDGSGVINIIHDVNYYDISAGWIIYGAGWNKDVPEIEDHNVRHILLTHQMIIKDKKLWVGQEGATKAKSLLFKHEFDLIVSGDNHQSFTQERKDRHLINCGSLMRSTIDQHGHQPCVYIYDIEGSLVKHGIPVDHFVDVMDVTKAVEETERNKKLEAFVDGLAEETGIEGLDFKKNMTVYLKKNKDKVSKGSIKLINEVMA
jgi:DNA repair exonuclease SbcCD nuclease subunit